MGSDPDAREFVRRAIPLAEELDSPFLWMLVHGNSALAALTIGDTHLAQHGFREELKLCRELAAMPFAHEGLQGLAAVAAAHDEVERAARLSGASEAHRYDQPKGPVDARIDTTFFEPARSHCGLDAWDAARRDGATLSLEDAIDYALDEPAPYDG